jgi:hypothetical protein
MTAAAPLPTTPRRTFLPNLFFDWPTPLPPPVLVSATPPVDFAAVRAALRAQSLELATVKIGFHTGFGDPDGLDEWMQRLDVAGVPFFLKSVDNAEPLYKAQLLMQQSGVPHVLVYRRSAPDFDLPNYSLSPAAAAQLHWQRHRDAFPPELDPSLVWIETVNEVDKNRSAWLAAFALETARLALRDGFRWAAFGWASGEPEPAHWQLPAMADFLRLAADHPDRLAVALHEYSYLSGDIADLYPHKVGRFQELFAACDRLGIARPTVLITEWGWEYQHVPPPAEALADIEWASWLYAAYPQVKGAAIWYLGAGSEFGDVAQQTQRLIAPLGDYTLSHYFAIHPGRGAVAPSLFQP